MRIAVLGLRGMPGVSGGIETHCEQLYGQLARLRATDDIFVLGRQAYLPDGPTRFGHVTVIPLPHLRSEKFETISNSLCGIFYSRFRLHADLVHVHGICSATLAPLAKLLGMKVVVTHHGRDYIRQKWSDVERLLLRMGEWCGAMFAHQVIAVSPSIARYLEEKYPGAHVSFVPNGADHLRRVPTESSEVSTILGRFGLRPEEFVMSVGRLDPDKGFDDLIAAFLQSECQGKLVIVGYDPRGSKYAKALLARASDRIIFTGFLRAPEIAALLSAASLFVLASHQEGFPICALEAAMIGTPLILSDIPATRDLAFEDRRFFPVGDVSALARMLSAPHERYSIPDRARLAQFQWASVAASTAATYDQAAGIPICTAVVGAD